MCDPASSMRTFMPALASSSAAQPPHAPEPTTIASKDMMLRMSAGGKFQVVRVAFVIESFDHTGASRVKGKRVLLLDQMVSGVSRVAGRMVALGFGHRLHQCFPAFRVRGMKSGIFQRCHRGAPPLLYIGDAIGRLQN